MTASRGHAVNFRQVFDGIETAEGGLVTVGLTGSAARRWKIAYVSSSLTRSTELASGSIGLSPAQAWARSASAVGEDFSVADVHTGKRLGGWQTLNVEGSDSVQRVKLVAFPTPRAGVVPAYESLVVDKSASTADRVFVDARDGRMLARFSMVHNLAEQAVAPVTIPFAGELPPVNAGCAPMHGPFAVGAGVRFLRVFADADGVGQDIVLRLFFGTTLDRRGRHLHRARGDPLRAHGRRPGGSYSVEVCEFPGPPGPVEPRTYVGTFTSDDSPAPHPYLARWQVFPANPPLATLTAYPWGNPSTDTRELWCWEPGEAADCNRVVGNLASRGPWDFNFKANAPTLTTIGNNANAATSWTHPFLPSPPQFRPSSPIAGLPDLVDERLVHARLRPDAGRPRGDLGRRGRDREPVRHAQPDARLRVLPGLHRAELERSGLQLRPDRDVPGERSGARQRPVRRARGPAGQREHDPAAEGISPITNMYMWQSVAGAFYAPCVDGDYDMGVIGHEYTHLIENRMIGKGRPAPAITPVRWARAPPT